MNGLVHDVSASLDTPLLYVLTTSCIAAEELDMDFGQMKMITHEPAPASRC